MFSRNKVNDGREYEDLIHYVYQQLSHLNGKDIKVQRNVKVVGNSGLKHQIDVYYEFEMNDLKHRVAIECKDHKGKIDKGRVMQFAKVLDELGNCTGIIASRNGFESGAKEIAKFYGIELVTGGELPLLSKVTAKQISVLLPDETIIGQPFWTIMEEGKTGGVTGTYICIREGVMGLFISKKITQEVSTRTGGVVRGISQKHLKAITAFAKMDMIKLELSLLDIETYLPITPDEIEENFIVS